MKTFSATTTVAAPPAVLWAILIDAPRFPEWDPNLDHIEGTIALGNALKVFTKQSPGRAFPVTVRVFEPDRGMTWSGGMPLGLFKGERTFTLVPQSDGGTVFTLKEVFSGLLSPLIVRTIPDLDPVFAAFAAGLKQRAEAVVSGR